MTWEQPTHRQRSRSRRPSRPVQISPLSFSSSTISTPRVP
jgi:hypothetical protein